MFSIVGTREVSTDGHSFFLFDLILILHERGSSSKAGRGAKFHNMLEAGMRWHVREVPYYKSYPHRPKKLLRLIAVR